MKREDRGFTLIELLIVIGIIAILAAGAMIAINPGRQFMQARNSNRLSHMNTIYTGLMAGTVDNAGSFETNCPHPYAEGGGTGDEDLAQTEGGTTYTWTYVNDTNCGHLTEYIRSIPEDPQGGPYLLRFATSDEQDVVIRASSTASDSDLPVFGE